MTKILPHSSTGSGAQGDASNDQPARWERAGDRGDLQEGTIDPMPRCCPRCQGFMITTQLKELWSSGVVDGWRCLLCGENIDPVIQVNRTSHTLPVQTRARVPGSPSARFAKAKVR